MKTRKQNRQSAAFRDAIKPVVEGLEGRTLFTVTVASYIDFDGNIGLRIRGDNTAETVVVTEDPTAGTVSVTATGLVGGFTSAPGIEYELFDVRLTGGDDSLTWNVITDWDGDSRSYMLDVGSGNDSLTVQAFDNQLINSSNVDFEIDGDPGNDVVLVDLDDVEDDSKLFLDLHTETGNDTATVNVDQVESDASYEADIDLGSGTNNLTLNLQSVESEGLVDIDVAGGSNGDTVNLNLQEDIYGRSFFDLALGSGNDTFVCTLANTFDVDDLGFAGDDNGELRINANGGSGNDTMSVVSNQSLFGAADTNVIYIDDDALFSINLLGGDGNDKLTVDLDGNDFTGSSGIESYGTLKVRVDGGNQNDTLVGRVSFGAGTTNGAKLDMQMRGGHHNDVATLALFDFSGGGLSYVGGYALLDGGNQYFDTGNVLRNVAASVRRQNFEAGATVIV